MKTFKDLLLKLGACDDAKIWAKEQTIEEVVKNCHRGDWLLWLSAKIDLPLKELTLAKGKCAETVKHLMKDERSKKAVEVAISFGLGKATKEDLKNAHEGAYVAYTDAVLFAYAYYASYTAVADAYAAYVAYTDDASYTANYAYYASRAANAYTKTNNQLQTANICREVLGQMIINKVNELLNGN